MEDFFVNIPDEILEKILKNIKIPELFLLSCVCKRWKFIITSGNVAKLSDLNYLKHWQNGGDVIIEDKFINSLVRVISPQMATEIDLFGTNITDKGIETLCHNFNSFRKINLNNCGNITDKGIGFLVRTNRHLRNVYLSHCNVTSVSMVLLAEYCRDLRKVDISINSLDDSCALYMAKRCTQLREIYFNDTWLTDKSAIAFAIHCPHLKYADFSWCHGMTDNGIIGMAENCNDELNAIFVGGDNISIEETEQRGTYFGIKNGELCGLIEYDDDYDDDY